MDFINKHVEIVKKASRIDAIAVWKDNTFFAKVGEKLYPIAYINDFIIGNKSVKYLYSLPTNDAHPVGTKSDCINSKFSNPEFIALWWGKYKDGMRIKGRINNEIFYESSIPTITRKSKR